MTEKYDGVRAIWTGSVFALKKKPQLHKHKILIPPIWVRAQLPKDTFLDGELWCGLQSITRLQKILSQKKITPNDWKDIKYMVFDSPDPKYREKPYMERFLEISKKLNHTAATNAPSKHHYVQLTTPHKCLSIDHLNSFLESIVTSGGEGIVLRHPDHPYKPLYTMWKKKVSYQGLFKSLI